MMGRNYLTNGNVKSHWIKESIKNTEFEDTYKTGLLLGSGSTAQVHKCLHRGTNQQWAVKVMKKSENPKFRNVVQAEIGVLLRLKHENVIRLKEVFENDHKISMVLELVTGGELFDRIVSRGYYSERDAAHCVNQMLCGLNYLHDNNIIHRDLKPENILYENSTDESHIKIADFGLSKIIGPEVQMQTVCGTPGYCAPEVLLGSTYTAAVDTWGVGVITYIMLVGYEPFAGNTDQETYKNILKCNYCFDSPYWDKISLNAKDLVSSLLIYDPNKRLTAVQGLRHAWVQGKGATRENLDGTTEKLKEFNARRKMKAAQTCVLIATKVIKRLEAPKQMAAGSM